MLQTNLTIWNSLKFKIQLVLILATKPPIKRIDRLLISLYWATRHGLRLTHRCLNVPRYLTSFRRTFDCFCRLQFAQRLDEAREGCLFFCQITTSCSSSATTSSAWSCCDSLSAYPCSECTKHTRYFEFCYKNKACLRSVCIEKLPVVAAHDSFFVLLRPGVAVPSCAQAQNYPTQQNKQRITPGNSWHVLSVDWPLKLRNYANFNFVSFKAEMARKNAIFWQ